MSLLQLKIRPANIRAFAEDCRDSKILLEYIVEELLHTYSPTHTMAEMETALATALYYVKEEA